MDRHRCLPHAVLRAGSVGGCPRVHLNELSPPAIRGTFPGFTYQIGNFLAALNLPLQSGIAEALGGDYRWSLVGVAGTAAVLLIGLMVFGRESKDVRMASSVARSRHTCDPAWIEEEARAEKSPAQASPPELTN